MSTIKTLDRSSGSSMKPLDIAFIAANAVGIGLYLRLASRGWRIPQEQGMAPVTGSHSSGLSSADARNLFLADIIWGRRAFARRRVQEKAMVVRHCGSVATCNRYRLLPSLIGEPVGWWGALAGA